jgi:hypothetical protein
MRQPLIRVLVAAALLAAGGAALWAGVAVDVPVVGKKLFIKDHADPAKRKAMYLSKDPSFSTAGMEPDVDGAEFYLFGHSPFQVDDFLLPASNWIEKKPGQFAYEDEDQAHGPVTKARLADGYIKVVAKGPGMTFDLAGAPPEGQGDISVHVVTRGAPPTHFVCSVFPGSQGKVKKNDPAKRVYLAVNAEATALSCNDILD